MSYEEGEGAAAYDWAEEGGGEGAAANADATLAIAGLGDDDDVTNSLPSFANAVNKELHAKILAKQKALSLAVAEGADHTERLAIMQEHLHNVRQELSHAQQLSQARKKELDTEEHLKSLTERAVGRMRAEIAALDKRSDGVSGALTAVQNNIFKGSERLEGFRAAMHMAQDELERWAAQARAKEEDNEAVERYTRGDELKVRDLVREQERLAVLVGERRRALEKEVVETKAKQVELDKMAEDFRAMHAERQGLIKQWQDNLVLIQRRDGDIATAAEHFAKAKAAVMARRQKLQEQDSLLLRLKSENEEMEGKIVQKVRQVGAARDETKVLQDRVDRFRDDVELLKANVSAAMNEVTKKKQAIASTEAAVEQKHKQIEVARQALDDIRAQLAHTTAQVASTESALAEREAYMQREEARVEGAERRLALLKDQHFKANEAVKKLREEESVLHAEIQGIKRTSKNLSDRIRELDAQSLAQQEHVYAAEFQIQQMERKIAKAKGEVSDEEKKILETRVGELNAELEEASVLEKGLQAQCKQVKEDLKQALREQTKLTDQLTEVQSRIDELLLQNKSAEDTLRKVVKEKEEAMVSHDVLKLEIRKLRDALSEKTDEVYGLENRGAQLAMTMDARKREIESERAIIRAEAKLAEEERHRVAMDLTERQARITLLKTKYETLCARIRGSDETGEPRSQAYFILKAAQKREELQREGDELDASIKKAERELKALTATLTHLNARNTALRDAFHRVDPSSDEAGSVRALEQQSREVADELFSKKKRMQTMQTEIEESNDKIIALENKVAALSAQLDSLKASRSKADADRRAQAEAVESTLTRVTAARLKHRTKYRSGPSGRSRPASAGGSTDQPTPDEIAFIANGIKECNSSVLFTVGQLAKEFTQLQPTLNALLAELGLKMPTRPPAKMGAGPPGGGATAPSSRMPSLPPTPVTVVTPAVPAAAPLAQTGLNGSLRRPPSVSSLSGAGKTIVAAPMGRGGASPMVTPGRASISSAGSFGRPGSASSQHSARSTGSRASNFGSGAVGGGLDLGLNGTRVNAGVVSTPSSAGSRR